MATEYARETSAFVGELIALRLAGDIDGAIAAVDRLFTDRRPGDRLLAQISEALFRTMALERSLSARLFCHLVARFNWRDARNPVALAYPEEHAILLGRLAAEDWYRGLRTRAAQPGNWIAAYAVARGGDRPLPPQPFDEAQKQEAQAILVALWEHEGFLLERFDAQTLAALREKIEGPPYIKVKSRSEKFNETVEGLSGAFIKRTFWLAIAKACGAVLLLIVTVPVLIILYPLVRFFRWAMPETMGVKTPSGASPAAPPEGATNASRQDKK